MSFDLPIPPPGPKRRFPITFEETQAARSALFAEAQAQRPPIPSAWPSERDDPFALGPIATIKEAMERAQEAEYERRRAKHEEVAQQRFERLTPIIDPITTVPELATGGVGGGSAADIPITPIPRWRDVRWPLKAQPDATPAAIPRQADLLGDIAGIGKPTSQPPTNLDQAKALWKLLNTPIPRFGPKAEEVGKEILFEGIEFGANFFEVVSAAALANFKVDGAQKAMANLRGGQSIEEALGPYRSLPLSVRLSTEAAVGIGPHGLAKIAATATKLIGKTLRPEIARAAADIPPIGGLSDMEARELYRLNTRSSLAAMKEAEQEIGSRLSQSQSAQSMKEFYPGWRPRPLRTAEEQLEAIADAKDELKVAEEALTEARTSELYDAEELKEFADAVQSARANLREVSKKITPAVRKAYDDQIASANAWDKKIESDYAKETARKAELEAKQAAPIAPPAVLP